MNAFKQQCIELRKKDYTLNEIMRVTGKGKSTIYLHIKDIPLSEKKRREIAENSRQQVRRLSGLRKGKALRPYKPFLKWSPNMVLLVAHLMFDGEIIRGRCAYNNRSRALIGRVQRLMSLVYKYSGHERVNRESGVVTISFNNVELEAFLQKKSFELLSVIDTMPRKFQREFLRAFFDDEGCMDYGVKTKTRRVRGYQDDTVVLRTAQKLLSNFEISSKLQGRNEVVISGKENLQKFQKFQKEINFSKGVRINGNRTNSIWKKDLEKRILLDMAIKSFKH